MGLSEPFAEVRSIEERDDGQEANQTSRGVLLLAEDNPFMDHGRASWPPKRTGAEQRRMDARLHYDLEVEFRKIGWGSLAYVYDEENDLFRFHDGRFALSREHADWALLRKRGRIK